MRGPVQAGSWSPGELEGRDERLPRILADLYAKDPILGPALASGLQTQSMAKAAASLAQDQATGGDQSMMAAQPDRLARLSRCRSTTA